MRDAPDAVAPAVVAVFVFVDVVAEVHDVVDGVFAHRVAVGVEETEGVVAAAVYREANFCDVVVGVGCRFCAAERTCVVAVAYVESVVAKKSLDIVFPSQIVS